MPGVPEVVRRWWERARAHERWQRWQPRLRIWGFTIGGALLAVVLAGRVRADIGPFDATVAARPSLGSQTTVRLAPLGTIVLDTHDWPMALDLRVDQIGLQEAERIAQNPAQVDQLGDDVADDVSRAIRRLALRCVIVAVLGGIAGSLLARAQWQSLARGSLAGVLVVTAVGGGTALTFDANAVSEPHYTGLLRAAPAAVGDVEAIIERYGEYRAQLSDLVGNVVTLYLAAEGLPTFAPDDGTIRLLHVSDIHLNVQAFDVIDQVADQFDVDAVVDTGDITDWGTQPETRMFTEIERLDVPYVWVRGNHDSPRTQNAMSAVPNAVVLDGDAADVAGLRIWGIGDPRYTPNKDQPTDDDDGGPDEVEQAVAYAPEVAEELAQDVPPEVDVVMVHDSRIAADLGGQVPLVLAGHTHKPSESVIEPPEDDGSEDDESEDEASEDEGDQDDEAADDADPADDRTTTTTATTTTTTVLDGAETVAQEGDGEPTETLLFIEGSTGGAGLRGLQGEEPHPLTATVLYFDEETRRLVAYDRITIKGFGETGATIDRQIIARDDEDAAGDRDDRDDPGANPARDAPTGG
ncbi:MAG TPA: metallophosphoesterase [Acidimicrobiales bacterium]